MSEHHHAPAKPHGQSHDATVEIVAYDPEWPERFRDEQRLLHEALAPWLAGAVEHIGSTAVNGLAAKPVIDMMAPVHSLDASSDAADAARGLGYQYHPYKSEVMHWFCKPSPALRTHHLHLVPIDSETWRARLAFRDALRSDPDLRRRYADLKSALAARYRLDRDAYTDAKAGFILDVVGRVLEGRARPA